MLQLAIKDREDKVALNQSRITIGRDAGNAVVLETDDVSGYHAEIHCDAGALYVVDLGSTNGTTVNGKRLKTRAKLAAWDKVAFASVEAEVVDTEGRRPTSVFRAVGAAAPSAEAESWRLVGERGTFEVTGSHVFGRDAGCDFTVPSGAVSRRHARLDLRDDRLTVTDLGSANGTFVNGQQVRERELAVGDEVKFDIECFRVERLGDGGRTSLRPAIGDGATQLRSAVDGGRTKVSPAAGTAVLPSAGDRLQVVDGMDAKSFALTRLKYAIGRTAASDIVLPVDSVSARHARLEKTEAGGWRLTDLQSTNGTFVNGRRIDSAELKPGDEVRFGEVKTKFTEDAPGSPQSQTTVIPSRSDTTLVEIVRGLPAWGYGAIAFVIVAAGTSVFLLRDTLPPVTPDRSSVDAKLQARQLWTVEAADRDAVIGTPALGNVNDDDFLDVVIPTRGGFVTAVDGEEGKVIYGRSVSETIMASATLGRITAEGPPAAIVATMAGLVYALGGDDGRELWSSEQDLDLGQIVNKPLLADVDGDGLDDIIVPTEKQGLVALGGDRGWKLWDTGEMTNGRVVGSPATADVNGDGIMDIVAATDRGQVLVVSAADGNVWELWSTQLQAKIEYASPVVVDVGDAKLVAVAAGGIVALDGVFGRVAWQALSGQTFMASPLALDSNRDGEDEVLAVTASGDAYLLSGRHGEDLSSGNVGGEVMATAALHDENDDGIPELFLVTRNCNLMVLDVSNMRSRLTINVPAPGECLASPVLGDLNRDGLLDAVVASNAATVVAFSFNRRVRKGGVVWGEFLGAAN